MKTNLYTIRDRKAGTYGTPFGSYNHETAIRDFKGFCSQVQNHYIADDLELYFVGEFNSATGEVSMNKDKPEFIFQNTEVVTDG